MVINNHEVEIIRKNVKNINLKVYPDLSIKVSAPEKMDISMIEKMIISKEEWINKQLKKYDEQIRIAKRKFVSGEDHYFNGKRYILKVHYSTVPCIKLINNTNIDMYVRKDSSLDSKKRLMSNFYRENLKAKLEKYIPKWEQEIGVQANNYFIRKMKNRWGSCNTNNKTIIFNLDLAKKKDCEIQYVIIHELLHLIERKHNENFKQLLNKYCPKWEIYRETLNEII